MRKSAMVFLCVALAGCAAYGEIHDAVVKETSPGLDSLEAKVLILAQEERSRAGLTPELVLNDQLCAAAREHSDDMAERDYFDHRSPDGSNALARVLRYDPKFRGTLAENIASRSNPAGVAEDEDALARHIVDAWLESPPHRATLLSPLFRLTGIGVAVKNGEIYVTQLFSAPMPLPVSASVIRD